MMSMHGLEENHQTPPDLLRRVNAHTPKVGRIFQRMYRRGFEPSQVSFIDLFIHPVETKGKQFKVPVHTGREGITKYFPSEGAAIAFAFQADRIFTAHSNLHHRGKNASCSEIQAVERQLAALDPRFATPKKRNSR